MDEMDMDELRVAFTGYVEAWLIGLDDKPADPIALQRCGVAEVGSLVFGTEGESEAAEGLERWFRDRLTVDPGVPGPFANLAYNVIGHALDLVDWTAIVEYIRSRPETFHPEAN